MLVIDAGTGMALGSDEARRFDSVRTEAFARYGKNANAVDQLRLERDAETFRVVLQEQANAAVAGRHGMRADAIDASSGFHLARELEHIIGNVLEESLPDLNGIDGSLFHNDMTIPVGATTYTQTRLGTAGEASFYRSGKNIPRVDVAKDEETFYIHPIATSFGWNLWEEAASNFANSGLIAAGTRTARRVVAELMDRATWYGAQDYKLYGILDYPWLPKFVAAVAFDGTAAADDVRAECMRLLNFPKLNSKNAARARRAVTSPRVREFLFTTPLGAAFPGKTIGQFIIENHATVNAIDEAWQLQGVGPGGTDGFLVYGDPMESISIAMPQPFTALPVERQGVEALQIFTATFGGVKMDKVANNCLAWVDAG